MLRAMREGVGKIITVVILGLIAVTFIFFNINFDNLGSTFAAKVNGEKIPMTEFDRAYQAQQTQYLQQYQIDIDDDFRKALRSDVLQGMIRQRAIEQRIESDGYRVTREQALAAIQDSSVFKVGDEFDETRFLQILRNEGLTPEAYLASVIQDLQVRTFENGLVDSSFFTPAEFRTYLELNNQRRRVARAEFDAASYADQVDITEDQIQEHYDQNGALYMTPETVDLEFIEVLQADIADSIEVSDADVMAYYEQHKDLYTVEEERSASHILFAVDDDDVDAAVVKANAALARINAGEDFATVAMELSDDAGTRAQGGSLGRVPRGLLPKPLEDLIYSLDVGEVGGPVTTEYGVHIVKVDQIFPGSEQPFDELKAELADQLRSERSEDKFYETVNKLDELAYSADHELASVAAELDLPLRTVMNFPRTGDPDRFENNAQVVTAAYSDRVLVEGRNSELLQLAPDDALVLRVTAHHEPEQEPLEDVHDEIKMELQTRATQDLASAAAEAFLAAAPDAENLPQLAEEQGGTWIEPDWVTRSETNLPTDLLSRIFSLAAPAEGEAVWDRVALTTGDQAVVGLYEIANGNPEDVSRDDRDQQLQQLAERSAVIEISGYADQVREEATVRIPEGVLDPAN